MLCVNNIVYAGDLVVFCPSNKGLQTRLTLCDQHSFSHDIKYNSEKSTAMITGKQRCKNVQFPSLKLNL